jgi:putative ABC transport system permease protein
MLGARPARGRFFAPDESRYGDPRAVVVLSYRFWKRRLASDPSALRHTITIDSASYSVIGIAQEGFGGVDLDAVDAWIPLAARRAGEGTAWYTALGSSVVELLARLDTHTDIRELNQRLTMQFLRTNVGMPWIDGGASVFTAPLLQARGPLGFGEQDARNLSLAIRLAGVGLAILVMAAANVASVLLMRGLRRRREIAVRLALGVSKRRLLLQLLTELAIMAALACGAALLLTVWTGSSLRALLLSDVRWQAGAVDFRVVAVAAALAVSASLAAALAPAALVFRNHISLALRAGAPEGAWRGSTVSMALLVTQVALCMALLVCAGSFTQSLRRAMRVDRGFDVAHLISVSVSGLPMPDATVDEAVARLNGVVGMTAAAAVYDFKPLGSGAPVWTMAGDTLHGARSPSCNFVDPAYLQVAGFTPVAGRGLTHQDLATSEPVAVVTQSMARALWPNGAVGQCFYSTWPVGCRRVVGVVADIRWNVLDVTPFQYFAPRAQAPVGLQSHSILVRTRSAVTTADAARVSSAIRASFGPGARIWIQPLAVRLDPQLRPWRVAALLFSLFGFLALAAAAAGIYGLVSYDATCRSREFAVRIALGASARRIRWYVVSGGLRSAAVGLLAGLGVATLAGRALASLLFETSALDPAVIAVAAGTVTLSTTLASVLAAQRATGIDPASVLNVE